MDHSTKVVSTILKLQSRFPKDFLNKYLGSVKNIPSKRAASLGANPAPFEKCAGWISSSQQPALIVFQECFSRFLVGYCTSASLTGGQARPIPWIAPKPRGDFGGQEFFRGWRGVPAETSSTGPAKKLPNVG